MTKEEFIKNNEGIFKSHYYPNDEVELLGKLYDQLSPPVIGVDWGKLIERKATNLVKSSYSQEEITEIMEALKLSIKWLSLQTGMDWETQANKVLDELLVQRGEDLSRVRHPIYGEERQLAIDLSKCFVGALSVPKELTDNFGMIYEKRKE